MNPVVEGGRFRYGIACQNVLVAFATGFGFAAARNSRNRVICGEAPCASSAAWLVQIS
jgi:hypothetical protein